MDTSRQTFVIYHGRCNDGFCAAWIIHKLIPTATFFPALHGCKTPDVIGKNVIFADFAYKRDVMLDIKNKAASLIVLDHHKTAYDRLSDLDFCHFNMKKSGARMVWDYFYGKKESPWLVNYTEDRDLHRWLLPHSRETNAALSSYPMDFKTWDSLDRLISSDDLRSSHSEFIKEGSSIVRYESRQLHDIVDHAREMMLDNHQILAANTSVSFNDVAGLICKNRLFGVAWYLREDGKYVYSLRSEEKGMDVSVVAEKHGGGGHCHSAGFEADSMLLREVPAGG